MLAHAARAIIQDAHLKGDVKLKLQHEIMHGVRTQMVKRGQ